MTKSDLRERQRPPCDRCTEPATHVRKLPLPLVHLCARHLDESILDGCVIIGGPGGWYEPVDAARDGEARRT